MSELFYGLAVLACPVGMGVMMWVMMRAGKATAPSQTEGAAELARMRTEIDRLREQQRAVNSSDR